MDRSAKDDGADAVTPAVVSATAEEEAGRTVEIDLEVVKAALNPWRNVRIRDSLRGSAEIDTTIVDFEERLADRRAPLDGLERSL